MSAPPAGAGKTNVAMLTIMHELGLHLRPDGTFDTSAFKIVYVAPMKVRRSRGSRRGGGGGWGRVGAWGAWGRGAASRSRGKHGVREGLAPPLWAWDRRSKRGMCSGLSAHEKHTVRIHTVRHR